MNEKYSHMQKTMLTFTIKHECQYSKLSIMSDIKGYISKLLRSNDIKYYSNIELGKNYDNPHLHIQLWHEDIESVNSIRSKVIDRFGLVDQLCDVSYCDNIDLNFDYVIKDYKIKDTNELLELDYHKRVYRDVLNKSIQFTSHTKEKYTKAIYKRAYYHGIKKSNVDILIDNCIINKDIKIIDNRVIQYVKLLMLYVFLSELVQYKTRYVYTGSKNQIQLRFLFLYWVFGFL